MVVFGETERHVGRLFSVGQAFDLSDGTYRVLLSGKPRPRSGECKTDIYVLAENIHNAQRIELKISFKAHNADFLENKMTAERSAQILGDNWREKMSNFILQIEQRFRNRPLIYKNKYGKTDEGSFTLGWKMELVNRTNGELSGHANLSNEEVAEVYGGYNLSPEKKHSSVNYQIIDNSGIANCVLNANVNNIPATQDAINLLVPTQTFAQANPNVYFVCKALNYRSFKEKYDGNRPLSVYVDWSVVQGKLAPTLVFDNPLGVRGDEVANRLLASFDALRIRTTNDIRSDNVLDPSVIY
jgi:hypothetical protein